MPQIIHITYNPDGKSFSLLDSYSLHPLYHASFSSSPTLKICLSRSSPSLSAFVSQVFSGTSITKSPVKEGPKSESKPDVYFHHDSQTTPPFATALLSWYQTSVTLSISSLIIPLTRPGGFNRTYTFTRPGTSEQFYWKNDGLLSGDFKLVDKGENVMARFRNKVFDVREVGTFEIFGAGAKDAVGTEGEGGAEEEWRDLVVLSGLAMLTMMQSVILGLLVLTGGKE